MDDFVSDGVERDFVFEDFVGFDIDGDDEAPVVEDAGIKLGVDLEDVVVRLVEKNFQDHPVEVSPSQVVDRVADVQAVYAIFLCGFTRNFEAKRLVELVLQLVDQNLEQIDAAKIVFALPVDDGAAQLLVAVYVEGNFLFRQKPNFFALVDYVLRIFYHVAHLQVLHQ